MAQSESKTKIIVCCHKPDLWKSNDVYMPIQGGKAISDVDLGIQGDDTGDNISEKNKTYCELTSIYWAWKNLKNVDYIGLSHYRRYFNFNNRGAAFSDFTPIKTEEFDKIDFTLPDFDSLFNKYDVVLAKPKIYPVSIYADYCLMHISEDINTLEEIIVSKYPEYKASIEYLFYKRNKISHYNMFIMKWDTFDRYCEWLFDILSNAEKEINISTYNNKQKRVWGYMAERLLLLLFVFHNQLKVKYYPLYYINNHVHLKNPLHRFQRHFRKHLAFLIGKKLFFYPKL